MIDKIFSRAFLKPIIFISIFMIVMTFIAFLYGRPKAEWNHLHFFLWVFDLRAKDNLAAWFQLILFILNGQLYFIIGMDIDNNLKVPAHIKTLIKLMGLLFLYLSIDDMLSVHSGLDIRLAKLIGIFSHTMPEIKGISWLVLYAPLGAIAFFVFLYVFANILKITTIPANIRGNIKLLLMGAAMSILAVVAFDLLEKVFWATQYNRTIFSCFEESLETIALLLFFSAGLQLSKGFSSQDSAISNKKSTSKRSVLE